MNPSPSTKGDVKLITEKVKHPDCRKLRGSKGQNVKGWLYGLLEAGLRQPGWVGGRPQRGRTDYAIAFLLTHSSSLSPTSTPMGPQDRDALPRDGSSDLAWCTTFTSLCSMLGDCLLFRNQAPLRVSWHGMRGKRLCHLPAKKIRMRTQSQHSQKLFHDV